MLAAIDLAGTFEDGCRDDAMRRDGTSVNLGVEWRVRQVTRLGEWDAGEDEVVHGKRRGGA